MRTISRRLVFLFPGFEPLSAAQHVERFRRSADKTAATWGLRAETAPRPADGSSSLIVTLSGADWRTETEIVVCDWSPLIFGYARRPATVRIADGTRALFDFALSGTFLRYCRVSWRYALFFLYPVVLLALTALAGLAIACLPLIAGRPAVHLLWSVPLGALFVAAFLAFAGRRLHLLTLMDDWAFARDFAHGADPAINASLAAHREVILERTSASDCDEIVVASHSLGSSLASIALAGALARGAPREKLHVLTVGSSLLKTALHSAAEDQREAVRSIVVANELSWVDVQAVSDVLNFYRSNPALSLGIEDGRTPAVARVSLGKSVGQRTRRLNNRSFFRRHRQFVYGAEKRQAHSFHMVLIGPVPFEHYVEAMSVDVPPLRPAACDDVETENQDR